ncbi:MAG: Na+/H+ antiporter subunit E [Anaerolineae bacterium]|jgi:multicomponent Na+:H+ antiporter subunit E|nr:Na+/H+ antiporter subunit E [Anaerolineae bacterium]
MSYLAKRLLLALLLALAWMILTRQVNLEGLILGYLLGIMMVWLLFRGRELEISPAGFLTQLIATVIYAAVLIRDIAISGVDVFLRILGFRPIQPGIVRVNIQDYNESIAALTAHGITITPGQLAVDFDDEAHVYVHCLDISSAATIDEQQTRRLKYLRRMLNLHGR